MNVFWSRPKFIPGFVGPSIKRTSVIFNHSISINKMDGQNDFISGHLLAIDLIIIDWMVINNHCSFFFFFGWVRRELPFQKQKQQEEKRKQTKRVINNHWFPVSPPSQWTPPHGKFLGKELPQSWHIGDPGKERRVAHFILSSRKKSCKVLLSFNVLLHHYKKIFKRLLVFQLEYFRALCTLTPFPFSCWHNRKHVA